MLNLVQETKNNFYLLRKMAGDFIRRDNSNYQKEGRTFIKSELMSYLGGIDKSTLQKYADESGITDFSGRAKFTLKEAYAIRNALRASSRVYVEPPFKRSTKQQCQVIAIQNQKGGVGKSTTSVNLASGLAIEFPQEYRVGIVDLDPQYNASRYWVKDLHLDEHYSVGDLMARDYELDEGEDETGFFSSCFLSTDIPNLRILPASQNHRSHEYTFHRENVLGTSDISPYDRLDYILDKVKDEFDIIIIDTPPSSGFVTINAYRAAKSVIFPVMLNKVDLDATCGYFTFIPELWDILESLNHKGYHFTKMLLTNVDENSHSESDVERNVNDVFHSMLLRERFKKSEAIKVCNNHRSTVFEMSRSQYPKTKKSFDGCVRNVSRVVSDIHWEIRNVWEKQELGA